MVARIIVTEIVMDLRGGEDVVSMISVNRGRMVEKDIFKTEDMRTPQETTTVLVGLNNYLNKMEDGRETMGEDDSGLAAKVKDRTRIETSLR